MEKKKVIIIVIIITSVILIGVLTYWLFIKKDEKDIVNSSNTKIFFYEELRDEYHRISYTLNKEKDTKDNEQLIAEYKCKSTDCSVCNQSFSLDENNAIIYDNDYYLFNYQDKSSIKLKIPNDDYKYIEIENDINGNPVTLILTTKDETKKMIFGIKSNKILINNDIYFSYMISGGKGNYYLLESDDKILLYDVDKEKSALEIKRNDIYSWDAYVTNDDVYIYGDYMGHTGGTISINRIYSLKNNLIYENMDESNINYAVLDLKNNQLIVVDINMGYFYIYSNDGKQIYKSKKYNEIYPYSDCVFYSAGGFDSKSEYNYFVVNDNHKLNIIDVHEKIISNIDNINDNSQLIGVYVSDELKNIARIRVVDRSLKIDDYSDDEIKTNSETREEVEKFIDITTFGYEYTYDVLTKTVKKSKYIDINFN